MTGWVYVMEQADYERWLSERGSGPSMAEEGEQLFVRHHCEVVTRAARPFTLRGSKASSDIPYRFRKARTCVS